MCRRIIGLNCPRAPWPSYCKTFWLEAGYLLTARAILSLSLSRCGGSFTNSDLQGKDAHTPVEPWLTVGGAQGRKVVETESSHSRLGRNKLLVLFTGHAHHFLLRLATAEGLNCSLFFSSKDQLDERQVPLVPPTHSPYFYAVPKYPGFLDHFLLFHWMRNSAHYQLPSEVLNHRA